MQLNLEGLCYIHIHVHCICLYQHTIKMTCLCLIQVGTGFSFTDDGGLSTSEEEVADNLYFCITQFLTIFSEYQASDLYITGEVHVYMCTTLASGLSQHLNLHVQCQKA